MDCRALEAWQSTSAITHSGFCMRKRACAITKQAYKLVAESALNHEGMHQILSYPIQTGVYTVIGSGIL